MAPAPSEATPCSGVTHPAVDTIAPVRQISRVRHRFAARVVCFTHTDDAKTGAEPVKSGNSPDNP